MPDASEIPPPSRNPQENAAPAEPFLNVPLPVVVVLGLLLGIHLLGQALGEDFQIWELYAFSFIPKRLVESDLASPVGAQYWSFLSHAFLHGSWFHVGSNSLWLLVFGTPVYRRLGALRASVLLAASAVGGAAAMLPFHWGEFVIMVGASGAVAGAMAAAMPVMYAPSFDRRLSDLSGIATVPPQALLFNRSALFFTAVFFGLQLLTGASQATTSTAFLNENVIAWEAHLGGFITGLVAFYLLDRRIASQPLQV